KERRRLSSHPAGDPAGGGDFDSLDGVAAQRAAHAAREARRGHRAFERWGPFQRFPGSDQFASAAQPAEFVVGKIAPLLPGRISDPSRPAGHRRDRGRLAMQNKASSWMIGTSLIASFLMGLLPMRAEPLFHNRVYEHQDYPF